MRRQFLKLWATITGRRKVVQARRERSYLKSIEVFNGDLSQKFITLHLAAQTPEEFVNAVNNQMRNVYHFKDFKLKDVKALHLFSSQNDEFIHTVYALEKSYGIFYVVISTNEVFFKFTENIDWKTEKAETFRIYEPSQKPAPACHDIFYKCKLKKGIVKVYNVYKEWINSDGNFDSSPYDGIYGVKFPVNFDDIVI